MAAWVSRTREMRGDTRPPERPSPAWPCKCLARSRESWSWRSFTLRRRTFSSSIASKRLSRSLYRIPTLREGPIARQRQGGRPREQHGSVNDSTNQTAPLEKSHVRSLSVAAALDVGEAEKQTECFGRVAPDRRREAETFRRVLKVDRNVCGASAMLAAWRIIAVRVGRERIATHALHTQFGGLLLP